MRTGANYHFAPGQRFQLDMATLLLQPVPYGVHTCWDQAGAQVRAVASQIKSTLSLAPDCSQGAGEAMCPGPGGREVRHSSREHSPGRDSFPEGWHRIKVLICDPLSSISSSGARCHLSIYSLVFSKLFMISLNFSRITFKDLCWWGLAAESWKGAFLASQPEDNREKY